MKSEKELLLLEMQLLKQEQQLLTALKVKQTAERASTNYSDYLNYINPRYDQQWFHKIIADYQQKLFNREIRKLMIFCPPQHGKSEAATRNFPAYVLGRDPEQMVAVVSYADTIAGNFNRDIKRRMQTEAYQAIFPDTVVGSAKSGYINNNDKVELVDRGGFLYTVGIGGALTSVTVDVGIIDDPVKDRQSANSPTVRDSTYSWYTDIFETRLNNDSVQMLIQTRWHEDDLSGRLLQRDGLFHPTSNPTGWVVVSFPALRTTEVNSYDRRPLGAALWPAKHSRERIEKIKADSSTTFEALYQQDPKPSKEALVYPNWIELDEWPAHLETYFGVGGDFGFTNDPTAFLRVAREGMNLYLDELCYERGMTNPDILRRYHALKISPQRISLWESAEPKSIKELQNGAYMEINGVLTKLPGINAKGIKKGAGSIEAGISKMNEFTVYYTKRSLNLKHEKNNYQYVMFQGVSTNVPIDKYNHLMDAARGYVYTMWGQPVRQYSGPDNS